MFNKVTTAAIVLSGLTFTSVANAHEAPLEHFIGNMLAQAVESTKQELQFSAQKAVLTANNMISFEQEETIVTKVTITDLESEEVTKEKAE